LVAITGISYECWTLTLTLPLILDPDEEDVIVEAIGEAQRESFDSLDLLLTDVQVVTAKVSLSFENELRVPRLRIPSLP
jgi:hypothetical protein